MGLVICEDCGKEHSDMDKTICPNCGRLYRNVAEFVPVVPEWKKRHDLDEKFHSEKVGWWWGFKHVREKYADDPEMLEYIDEQEAEWDNGAKWRFYYWHFVKSAAAVAGLWFAMEFIW